MDEILDNLSNQISKLNGTEHVDHMLDIYKDLVDFQVENERDHLEKDIKLVVLFSFVLTAGWACCIKKLKTALSD